MTWDFDAAKDHLPEVIQRALDEGPQTITHVDDSVVVISSARYAELTGRKPGFIEFLTQGPSFEGLDLTREGSTMRDIEL